MLYLPSTAWFVLLITLDQQKVHFKIFRVSFSGRLLFQVFSLFGKIFALTLPHQVKNDRKAKRWFDMDLTADSMPSYISERPLLFMQTVSLRLYWHHHRTVLYSAWLFAMHTEHFRKKKNQTHGSRSRKLCQMHKDELWQQKVAEKWALQQIAAESEHLPPQLALLCAKKAEARAAGQRVPAAGVTYTFVAMRRLRGSSVWSSWVSKGCQSCGSEPVPVCQDMSAWQWCGPWWRGVSSKLQPKQDHISYKMALSIAKN